MTKISLKKIIDNYNLVNHTPDIPTEKLWINIPDINRPALQLAGFFDHFDKERVQIIGNVEWAYLSSMTQDRRRSVYQMLMASGIPCLILCRGIEPDNDLVAFGNHYGVPILTTELPTSRFNAEIVRWLNEQLAPCISIHGVLVDVYGEGVLIMGESGIGKSEAALELIKRGHRLVTDDVVEIRRVSDETLIGTSPDITKHFIELRGIGIIDVKTLFGVEHVKETQQIDMVIQLEEWSRDKEYDRLGLEDQYTEFLGNKVVCYKIPIRPGRNLAVIAEAAAVNHRQKKMGYNAAQELYNRVTNNILKKKSEDEE
ncbi:MAG: HPr(Ser) kinase/phosphatase [Lachnospiraceae bacterium]|nr:HPr(Ser) kinase/phosphatase [Lachnospiraceae bacterium]